jgi:hypothetical protein
MAPRRGDSTRAIQNKKLLRVSFCEGGGDPRVLASVAVEEEDAMVAHGRVMGFEAAVVRNHGRGLVFCRILMRRRRLPGDYQEWITVAEALKFVMWQAGGGTQPGQTTTCFGE